MYSRQKSATQNTSHTHHMKRVQRPVMKALEKEQKSEYRRDTKARRKKPT
jgi:hypothetical protein